MKYKTHSILYFWNTWYLLLRTVLLQKCFICCENLKIWWTMWNVNYKIFLELYPNLWFWQSMSVRKNILYQYLVMVLNKHSFWLCNILRKLNSFPLYILKNLQYYLCTHIYYISCGFFVWFFKVEYCYSFKDLHKHNVEHNPLLQSICYAVLTWVF